MEANRLTIEEIVPRPEGERKYLSFKQWAICKCSCGNTICVPKSLVLNNSIKSCGCLRAQKAREIMNAKIHTSSKYIDKLIMVEYEGETLTLRQWAHHFDIPYSTLVYRYAAGVRPPELFSRFLTRRRGRNATRQN